MPRCSDTGGVEVEALPIDCGGSRWLRAFDGLWSRKSPAAISYRHRISAGPGYRVAQAVRAGVEMRHT